MPEDEGHDGSRLELDSTAASQGVRLGRMRYVLGLSLVLTIVALVAVYRWTAG